jgi:predicted RNA binding protein YcfA (HicA-like mRNA interferase family)
MKYRDILRLLEDDGWFLVRTNGSHRICQHPTKPGSIPVPVHSLGNDIPTGLRQAILRQAGLR